MTTTAEVAKYRRQLRDAQTERDALAARVEALQRAEVNRLVRDEHQLKQPESFWAAGTTLADTLDDNGNVDAGKVYAAARQAIDTLGLDVFTHPSFDGGARTPPPIRPATWADALSSADRVATVVVHKNTVTTHITPGNPLIPSTTTQETT